MNTSAIIDSSILGCRCLVIALFRRAILDARAGIKDGDVWQVDDACSFLACPGAADLAEELGLNRNAPSRLAGKFLDQCPYELPLVQLTMTFSEAI